jgi:hypothetical protein
VIGLVWGIWHIPSFLYFGMGSMEVAMGVMGAIPLAILYTWFYKHTTGSLLLVTLFHLGQQLSRNLLGSWPGHVDDILIWVIALLLILASGEKYLSLEYSLARQKEKA